MSARRSRPWAKAIAASPFAPGDDELGRLADQVNRTSRDLERREAERDASEQARRDLIAAISHDLLTPLNSLRPIAGAVADEHTLWRHLGQIGVNVDSLDTLIEDLFELSRIEAGLRIARAIVEAHGGRFRVERTSPQGTQISSRFSVLASPRRGP